ncbi:MAG TPA: adenosine deaminase family protein [Spirochaetia bacterium]|nr:adenosine deaminase family protein [Spirochaetia bacterium]
MHYPPEFIKAIPKNDLHVHLDGSLRLQTLIELARDQNVELPSYTPEGLRETVFKPSYADLDEYLRGFAYTCRVMQDEESLERIAYELAQDNIEEGVRYVEVRFAPQLHISDLMSFEQVMHSVDKGLRRARDEYNRGLEAHEPAFEYGIIVTAMRFFTPKFSAYYSDLARVHRYSSDDELIRMASLELAKASVRLRNETEVQVIAFDLAGSEYGYPASAHQDAYDFVHSNFMKKTVHAGEAYGPESIFQAITKIHADRIGHGLRLFRADMVYGDDVTDPERYVANLANYIADKRITVEVCLTSNLQTCPDIRTIADHSLGQMLDMNLSLSICTDNRLVSDTTVTREIELAIEGFDIQPKQLKNIMIYGFKRSFFYRPYSEKRQWVRQITNYYEQLEKKYGIA